MSETTASRYDRSLVEGPLPAAIWKLAWPTMLQNVVAGLQGLVDHVMVGHYVGYTGNAAIGVSWQIFLVVVVFIGSLYTGMGILVARSAGAGNERRVNRVVYQAFLTSVCLTACVLAPVGYFLAPRLLEVVNAAPEVRAEALPYLRIMLVFSFGMLLFFMLGGALRAAGDARTPLRLGVAMTALNLAFNVVLIRGLGPIPAFGTKGAAMGTVLASGVVGAVALVLLFRDKLVIRFSREVGLGPDLKIIASLFRFGLPSGFQGVVMNIGGVLLIRYVGALDASAAAQAAYSVGYNQLFAFVTWISIALMGASSAITGQSLGAGRLERARDTPRTASLLGLAGSVLPIVLFLAAPGMLLGLFGMEDVEVLTLGRQLLAFLSLSALFMPVALSHTGALQGAGDTRSPLYISLISQLVLPLGYCAVLDHTRGLMPADIWLAIVFGHFTRATLSTLRFRQGGWRRIEVAITDE